MSAAIVLWDWAGLRVCQCQEDASSSDGRKVRQSWIPLTVPVFLSEKRKMRSLGKLADVAALRSVGRRAGSTRMALHPVFWI